MARGSFGWLTGTARRWFALIAAVATVGSVLAFLVSHTQSAAWLAIGALVLLTVALAWTARDEHRARVKAEDLLPGREKARRERLREVLEASVTRGRHAGQDQSSDLPWRFKQCKEWRETTFGLLNDALGPQVAQDFAKAMFPASPKPSRDFQDEILRGVGFMGELINRLDSLPVMGDWNP